MMNMTNKILNAIIDYSYDGLTYTDKDGVITYCNEAYYEITGLSEQELIGKNIFDLAKLGYQHSILCKEVFETKSIVNRKISYRKGSSVEVLITLIPLYIDNCFYGIVGNIRDITELNFLYKKLERIEASYSKQIVENKILKEKLSKIQINLSKYNFIGRSSHMRGLVELAQKISNVDTTILITGESGVGKDVFCKMICNFSNKNYIKVSCGAIPENLLESELFGYEPGAFTGASKEGKKGIFQLADDGVIFLDEIAEMPQKLQVKLLTAIQDKEFYPIGGNKPIKFKARIISATNKNLLNEVKNGNFREDLYYRLNVIPIYIKPLRERKEDIIPIATHIMNVLSEQYNNKKRLSADLKNILEDYNWPGNIRELHNVIERMYVLSPNNTLNLGDAPEEILGTKDFYPMVSENEIHPLRDSIEEYEAFLLNKYIDKGITLKELSIFLEVDISTLTRKMRKYKIKSKNKKSKLDEEEQID